MTAHELARKLLEGPDLPVVHDVTSECDGSTSLVRIDKILHNNQLHYGYLDEWQDGRNYRKFIEYPCIIISDSDFQ